MMNKSELKNFAVNARLELLRRVTDRASLYGVSEENCKSKTLVPSDQFQKPGGAMLSNTEIAQRNALLIRIRENGYRQTIEEAAYTWFNRFIALRYMQAHNRLPVSMRVFPDAPGTQPQMLREAQDVDLPNVSLDQILAMLEENQTDALYKLLLIALCNALSEPLPRMFETISDYTELLFPDGLLKADSVLGEMAKLDEDCWADIQVIGWLYQYYNTQLKDETFELLKKNVKITKERIGAATQLFTPEWIVNYMVENSLGRLWLEGHFDANLRMKWRYYMDEAEQTPEVAACLAEIREPYASLQPEQLTLLDPCMGSGHILVYAFDVLMDIYRSVGYTDRDAVQSIVQNNLYGLDIDDRAAQLAYFAVMMKACDYDRRFLRRGIQPHVCAIQESAKIEDCKLDAFGEEKPLAKYLLNTFADAKEYGSILHVNLASEELTCLRSRVEQMRQESQSSLIGMADNAEAIAAIEPLLAQAEILAHKYDAVITNPPYMGSSGMNEKLSKFVKENYPDSKSDLFAVFMERGLEWVKGNGYSSMVTMQSWMFLSSFEKMRNQIINQKSIAALMHMENMVMGIAFGTAVAVIRNAVIKGYKGTYNHIKYEDIVDARPQTFPVDGNRFAQVSMENFTKIPGHPIAYWVSERMFDAFVDNPVIGEIANPVEGIKTGDNDRYVRLWFEVMRQEAMLQTVEDDNSKWRAMTKGGMYRKWYGNLEYVVAWGKDGSIIRKATGSSLPNGELFFTPAITWTYITSGRFSMRTVPKFVLYNNKGPACYVDEKYKLYLLAVMNTVIAQYILDIIAPTIDCKPGNIANYPISINKQQMRKVQKNAESSVQLSKSDWDSFETSWDFKKHPLI